MSVYAEAWCGLCFLLWCAKGMWCACIDRGLKIETPISARLAIHPGPGVWGSEEGGGGVGGVADAKTVLLSD